MGDVIWTNNAKGEMVGEQPGWAAFTGQSFEEYQGFGGSKAIHPDDMEIIPRVASVRWSTSENSRPRCRVRRHDGQYRLMSSTAVPVFNEDRTVREWVGAMTDITDVRRGEEEVRESDERFQGLATAFPQLVWSSKPDGNLEYANALWKEYTGPSEEIGRRARVLGRSAASRRLGTAYGTLARVDSVRQNVRVAGPLTQDARTEPIAGLFAAPSPFADAKTGSSDGWARALILTTR